MNGVEVLLLGALTIMVIAPGPAFAFDVGYYKKHGYVPNGWRKRDRILRSEHPKLFWFLTTGRLLLLGVTVILWIAFLVAMVIS